MNRGRLLWAIAVICAGGILHESAAAQEREPVVVSKILRVSYDRETNPSELRITAEAEVRNGGFSQPRLLQIYRLPAPADGMLDLFFIATPPTFGATAAMTRLEAKTQWKHFDRRGTWIKGIRVHGAGDEILTLMLGSEGKGEATPGRVERTFSGESKEGNVQEALNNALSELDRALAEGIVADASATWKVVSTTGERGGQLAKKSVKVTIAAKRMPEWDAQR